MLIVGDLVILLLRVWVLYSRSRKLGVFLGTLFQASCGTALYIRLRDPDVSPYPHPGCFTDFKLEGCIITPNSKPWVPASPSLLYHGTNLLLSSTSFFDDLPEDRSKG